MHKIIAQIICMFFTGNLLLAQVGSTNFISTQNTSNTEIIANQKLDIRGEPLIVTVQNQSLELDKIYVIDFYLEKAENIEALKFTLEANQHAIEIIKVTPNLQYDFKATNFKLFQNLNSLSVEWVKDDNPILKGGNMLFSVMIKVLKPISIEQAFNISSKIIGASGINKNGETVPVNLNVENNIPTLTSFFVSFGPNPVEHELIFSCYLTQGMSVSFFLIDQMGRSHRKLLERYFEKGNNNVQIDVSDFANGVYYLNAIINGNAQSTQKLMIYR